MNITKVDSLSCPSPGQVYSVYVIHCLHFPWAVEQAFQRSELSKILQTLMRAIELQGYNLPTWGLPVQHSPHSVETWPPSLPLNNQVLASPNSAGFCRSMDPSQPLFDSRENTRWNQSSKSIETRCDVKPRPWLGKPESESCAWSLLLSSSASRESEEVFQPQQCVASESRYAARSPHALSLAARWGLTDPWRDFWRSITIEFVAPAESCQRTTSNWECLHQTLLACASWSKQPHVSQLSKCSEVRPEVLSITKYMKSLTPITDKTPAQKYQERDRSSPTPLPDTIVIKKPVQRSKSPRYEHAMNVENTVQSFLVSVVALLDKADEVRSTNYLRTQATTL